VPVSGGGEGRQLPWIDVRRSYNRLMKTAHRSSSLDEGHALAHLRGRPVVDFFPHLCRLRPEIAELRFETFEPRPGIDERLSALLTEQFRHEEWDRRNPGYGQRPPLGCRGVSLHVNGAISDEIVDTALLHEPNPTTVTTSLSAQSIIEGQVAVSFQERRKRQQHRGLF